MATVARGVADMAEIQEILVDAARSGNVIALDGILKEYKDHIDINFLTDGGVTLLMHAISGKSFEYCANTLSSSPINYSCRSESAIRAVLGSSAVAGSG